MIAILEDEREQLHDAVLDALADERYLRLLDMFAASVASLPDLDAPGGLRPLAAAELRKLVKAGRKLDDDPADDELHALRIRAKRARYAAELAAIGHGSKAFTRYLDALKALQDVIGEHQDAVVAESKLRSIARREDRGRRRTADRTRTRAPRRAPAALSGRPGACCPPRQRSPRHDGLSPLVHTRARRKGLWF